MQSDNSFYTAVKVLYIADLIGYHKHKLQIIPGSELQQWLTRFSSIYPELRRITDIHASYQYAIVLNGMPSGQPQPDISRPLLGIASAACSRYGVADQIRLLNMLWEIIAVNYPDSFESQALLGMFRRLYIHSADPGDAEDIDHQHVSGLLNPVSFFLGNYKQFTLANFERWDEIDRKVQKRIDFMKAAGEKRGYLYDPYAPYEAEREQPGIFD